MKLGIQTQTLNRQVLDFCLRAKVGVFKSIAPQSVDLLWELKRALPECKFIYRPMFATQPLDDPKRRAREAVDAAMGHLAQIPYDYTELYNETGLWEEAAYNYIALTIEAARLLQIQGQKLLAYSFSWGNPCGFISDPYDDDPARWMEGLRQHWAPYYDGLRAVQAAGGGLALHQYKIPGEDDRFSIFRHRLVRQVLPAALKEIPIWLTEFGLDDKAKPGLSGFRGSSWNWPPERYAQWLIDTTREIGNEVEGATIFGCGMPGWWSFDILGYPVIADAIRVANEEEKGNMIDIVDSLPRSGIPLHRPLSEIQHIVIHHAAVVTTPEATARYHVEGMGWPCIGYHYFIEEDGTVYRCAKHTEITYHAGGDPNPTYGVGNNNVKGVGICLSGAYHGANPPPPEAQQEALVGLVSDLQGELELGNDAVKGHYELRPTLCPGSEWFEDWRNRFFPSGNKDEVANLKRMIDKMERELGESKSENAEMRDDMDMIAEIAERWRSN